MNLTIILILVGVIGGFIFGCCGGWGVSDGLLCALLGFLIACALSMFICGFIVPAVAEVNGAAHTIERVDVKPLYALKDNSNISGSFFLGTGSVDEDNYYYYITREEGKGYSVNKMAAGGYTYLEYLSAEGCEYDEPCLVYYHDEWENKVLRFFAWSPINWHTFYIPEGSIIENYYEIDLES